MISAIRGWPHSVRLYLTTFLVVGMSLTLLGPALTELRDKSGSGIGSIGVLFTAQSIGYIAGSSVAGWLFDRLPGHRVYSIALVVLAAGLVALPRVDSLVAMMVVVVVIGLGGAVNDLGANTLLMWEMGPAGRMPMNLLHTCFGIGALAAPLLVYAGLGVATGLGAAGCLLLAVWSVRVDAPPRPPVGREEHTDATLPILLILTVFFATYVGLEIGFAGWVRTYGEQIGFDDFSATWLVTGFWIGFTLGRLVASLLADRYSPAAMLWSSSGAALVAASVLVVGDGRAGAVWVGTVLMGIATAPQFAAMMNLAEQRIHVTGAATRWFIGGAGVGGLLFPWVIGRWIDAGGASALAWASLLFAVATLAALVGVARALRT